jgi:hypothetical protein
MSGAPRLCQDCRWVTWPWPNVRDSGGGMCVHPSIVPTTPEPDLVTGSPPLPPGAFCEMERRSGRPGACGPTGRHWEPRAAKPVGFT